MDSEKMDKIKSDLNFGYSLWNLVDDIFRETKNWVKGKNKLT